MLETVRRKIDKAALASQASCKYREIENNLVFDMDISANDATFQSTNMRDSNKLFERLITVTVRAPEAPSSARFQAPGRGRLSTVSTVRAELRR